MKLTTWVNINFIALIFCFFSNCTYSEANNSNNKTNVNNNMNINLLDKLVIVTTTFADNNGNEIPQKEIGGGFIIDGKYLATCYHVVYPPNIGYSTKSVKVEYNFRPSNGQLISDSTSVDLTYKYSGKQYDFSKHNYINGDYTTDFIILKLKQEVVYENLVVNTTINLPKYTLMPIIGYDNTVNSIRSDKLTYLFAQFVGGKQDSYQLVLFGIAKQGFSGSPVFNVKNEIVGILQYGADVINLQYLNEVKLFNFINEQDLNAIKMGYSDRDKQTITFATNIKYLYDRYISTFKE